MFVSAGRNWWWSSVAVLFTIWFFIIYKEFSTKCNAEKTSAPTSTSRVRLVDKLKKTAFTVVTSPQPSVWMSLLNFHHHLPSTWKIMVFFTSNARSFISTLGNNSAVRTLVKDRRFLLRQIPADKIENNNISFLFTKHTYIWEQLDADKVLFFQPDSVICGNSPHSIDYFLGNDFIGPSKLSGKREGNEISGAFSLRSTRKMLECILLYTPQEELEEETFFENCFETISSIQPVAKVTEEDQQKFAVESVYSPSPLGVRGAWKWLKTEEWLDLVHYCPEVRLVAP
eukprot:TRINITY_DN7092_c0_g1_i1.p1 TRINITY_DN7092_c0_g1~~TRINITY_DN7092_c0_g1_i1.p1  ORF type:complete len:285 (-),score=39.32 TRINITY_DN7092_c0_g1_i1:855-1709(-)